MPDETEKRVHEAAIARIARDLAAALVKRSHDRQPDDLKRVLELQTRLVEAVNDESMAMTKP